MIKVEPTWSPLGAARFMELVDQDFFRDMLLYRAVKGFLVQFGVSHNPHENTQWSQKKLDDEPKPPQWTRGNWEEGLMSYAGSGPRSRDHHMFITLAQPGETVNPYLGSEIHEVPFAKIISGLDIIKSIEFRHDDAPIRLQQEFQKKGNAFMLKSFPGLDRLLTCFRVQLPGDPEVIRQPHQMDLPPAEKIASKITPPKRAQGDLPPRGASRAAPERLPPSSPPTPQKFLPPHDELRRL